MFWFFRKKSDTEGIKEDTKKGFEFVKKDISALTGWIKHLDSEKNINKRDIDEVKSELSSIKNEIENIKNIVSITNELKSNHLFKTPKRVFEKQTSVYSVQTGVQTGVQTPNIDMFSVTERAILFILLNSEMKLSYDDLASMLGKEKSTIRGQINSIKQKGGEIISENIEKNGKKRVFIHEELKEKMLKKTKVRVKTK
jgi:hypothetical protein